MGTALRVPIPFPLPEDLTGNKVGRFLIRSKLGSGGMGEVYYAEDTTLRRPVALKRVARKLGHDPQARVRILSEARRASILTSEHIAGIHDVLEESGELFLVMEYVEGENLRQRLQRPITLDEFFHIATQCAQALKTAHEHGIVHCDIKPENIMLTPARQVKILDFGLAKHMPRSDQSSTLESCGHLAGTPAYMAPEILLEGLPDARTDIFSLAIVFYEMLTRRNPFSRSSFVATSDRTLHDNPLPIRALNPSVPVTLESVVMKAMAKTPSQRYANADDLLRSLQEAQSQELLKDVGPDLVLSDRRKVRWLVVASVLVVALALSFAAHHLKHQPPVFAEHGWLLISDFETPKDESIPDQAIREGLTIALQQSRYMNVFPRTRAYEVLQRMKKADTRRIDETLAREICQREGLQVLLAGSISHVGQVFQITVRALEPGRSSLLFAEQERFDRLDQFFDKADSLAVKIRKDLGESLDHIENSSRPLARVTTASITALELYSQASDASNQAKNEEVPAFLKSALQIDPNFAMAHLRLGQYYSVGVGKNEKAVAELKRAYDLREQVTERERYRIEAAYYALLEQYEDEAQSLGILVTQYPDDEESHLELASAYRDIGRLDWAILEAREVLRLNPNSAPAFQRLVLYLAHENQNEAAISVGREAQRRTLDPPQMYWGMGLAYLGMDEVSMARQAFDRSGQGTETDRELQELNLVVADLYEGKLESARAALGSQIRASSKQEEGLQAIRRNLLGRIFLSQGNLRAAGLEALVISAAPATGLQTYDLLNAGTLYARSRSMDQAHEVLRRMDLSRRSVPSGWNQSCYHNLEGEIRMAEANPEKAAESFTRAARDYPQIFSHAGLARAFEMQKRWSLVAQEWEQVLEHKGEVLQDGFPPDLAYAHLQAARAYRVINNRDPARRHYADFLRMWQGSDQLRLLEDVRREQAELAVANVAH